MADSKIAPAEKYSIRQSRDIAAEASTEMDPAKLLRLVTELNEALRRESNDKIRTA